MDSKLITGVLGVVVVFALLGYVLVPVIDNLTDGGTETQTLSQEGAGWVRMVYDTAPNSYYAVNLAVSDDAYTATNNIQDGAEPDVQSGSDDSILYADSNLAVWGQDGSIIVLGTDADGANYFLQSDDGVRVVRSEDKVEVFDVGGTDLYATFGVPSYAFIPVSTGGYGFFENGTEAALQENVPAPIVGGGFAGVFASGDMIRFGGLGLQLQKEFTEDGKLVGAYWAKAAAPEANLEDFDPSSITITPLDPGVISLDPEPTAVIMSVPTPSYTDGVWGYELDTSTGTTKAIIVSYSGVGGDVTVPAKVGGYDVLRVGKDSWNSTSASHNVMDNNSIASNTTLRFEEGIQDIGGAAFSNCSKITSITLPNSLIHIGESSFTSTGLTSLVIPGNVTDIGVINGQGNGAFRSAPITGPLVIPNSVTTIGRAAFFGTSITSLDLGSVDNIGVAAFASCTSLAGFVEIPDGVTTLPDSSNTVNGLFNGCTNLEGFVIPASVTTIGRNVIPNCTGLYSIVIASNAAPPDNTYFSTNTGIGEILDLSDDIDYSVDRYGLPAAATVEESTDAIGYISYSEIEITVPGSGGLGGSAASLLYVIPAVIIATLLIAAVGWFVYNRY